MPERRTREVLGLALVATVALATTTALAPATARAGNEEGVLVGNEAAMSGGAVTAVVDDGTGGWYNPAGVAQVERSSVDASGSATQLRLAETPRLLQSATGAYADGGYYELGGIPSAVTAARRLEPGLVIAVGLFVPSMINHTDRVRLDEESAGATTTWQLVQQENVQRYYAGITLGYRVSSNLRIGATLYGLYRQQTTVSQFFGGTPGPGGFVGGVSALGTLQSAGLELGVGLQWEIVPGLHFGLSVRTPALQLGVLRRATVTEIAASADGVIFTPTDDMGLVPRVEIITPTRVRVGLAYRLERGWVGLDADISHELHLPEFGIERRWLVNVRVGGRYEVDPGISIGGGLFTDLSPVSTLVTYGETRIDFAGGSLGLELHTPHRMAEGEQAETLVFSQTFALRYAVGIGTVAGLRFDTTQPAGEQVSVIGTDTTVHELALHLGSELHF
jgi:hypothetical protein